MELRIKIRRIVTVLGLVFVNLAVLKENIASATSECELPVKHGEVAWQSNLTGTVVDVKWNYGKENCNSEVSCFGVNGTENIPMDVQLKPLQIQRGQLVRFVPGTSFSMQAFRVDLEGFDACDSSYGQAVSNQPVTTAFIVEERYLALGSNLFIGEFSHAYLGHFLPSFFFSLISFLRLV
ncbi:uncharacterized protein LOC110980933 [Acanthaster planci]|uniref:Uncharacterized protein LOC110980933 n=1 Tax=Acanthaster planci TaxID=133434 RepID=A0A8B7YKB2_ACAPL|nr:uncharacterized protein LOC110980933 [Acanthaster planci]